MLQHGQGDEGICWGHGDTQLSTNARCQQLPCAPVLHLTFCQQGHLNYVNLLMQLASRLATRQLPCKAPMVMLCWPSLALILEIYKFLAEPS